MFAGTDGGYSKHGNGGYELGNLCFGSIVCLFLSCTVMSLYLSAGEPASISTDDSTFRTSA